MNKQKQDQHALSAVPKARADILPADKLAVCIRPKVINVLVVDDGDTQRNFIVRKVISTVKSDPSHFSDVGLSVAATFEEAKAAIAEKNYDAVFLDNCLPGGNGYTLIDEIRARNPSVKIAGTSADSAKSLEKYPKPDYQSSIRMLPTQIAGILFSDIAKSMDSEGAKEPII